jgi:uncharacterized membrane protein
MTILFIAIGIFNTLLHFRRTINVYSLFEIEAPRYLEHKLDLEYYVLSLVCTIILALSLALPFVFVGYDMNRIYFQMMTILSPFFIIGGIVITRLFHSQKYYLVIILALIPYFLCNTGMTYQVFGVSQSISLNSKGQEYDTVYVHEQESISAKWLKTNISYISKISSDRYGTNRLLSQANITSAIYAKSLFENNQMLANSYFYLGYTGTIENKLLDNNYNWHNISKYQYEFSNLDLIYSNNGSQIWK